jgi:hypothetical protein
MRVESAHGDRANQPTNESDEASGIHKKTSLPYVAAPANREALLARLRQRRVG